MAKSPDPTDVGQTAQWFDNIKSGGGFSLTAGYGTITSSTNATPIKITKNSHGLSNGDVVLITGHTINTNANGWFIVSNVAANTFDLEGSIGNGIGGATGYYWRRNSMAVVLTTAVTTEIDKTYTNWHREQMLRQQAHGPALNPGITVFVLLLEHHAGQTK